MKSKSSIFCCCCFWCHVQEIIAKSRSCNFSPMLSFKNFIVLGLTFKSLIHFELMFGYSVEKTNSKLNDLSSLVNNHLTIYVRVYFWAFYSIGLSFVFQHHAGFCFVFIEIELIYNIVWVSGVQHSESFLQIIFCYRLLQDSGYNSLCYIVNPFFLSILYIAVCISSSHTRKLSLLLSLSPLVTTSLFSMSVNLFCIYIHLYYFFGFHI